MILYAISMAQMCETQNFWGFFVFVRFTCCLTCLASPCILKMSFSFFREQQTSRLDNMTVFIGPISVIVMLSTLLIMTINLYCSNVWRLQPRSGPFVLSVFQTWLPICFFGILGLGYACFVNFLLIWHYITDSSVQLRRNHYVGGQKKDSNCFSSSLT